MKVPKKPSGRRAMPFYWWRRFRSHKCLPPKTSLLDKIQNGDFEYSRFYQEAKWELHWMVEDQKEFIENYQGKDPKQDRLYLDIELRARKRYNKLFEDAIKEENDRLYKLVNALHKQFKMSKDDIRDLMSEFGGTTEKLYYYIAQVQGMNVDNIKTLNKWGISSAG
jgi:hypothetical protein|tara:strand:+ start:572 stop:1069 length:498 start_codon:yes stop_codon:yes gene_type:complete